MSNQELALANLPRMKLALTDIAKAGGGFTNPRTVRADNTQLRNSIIQKGLLVDPIVWHRPGEDPEYILIQGGNRFSCLEWIVERYNNGAEVFGEVFFRVYEGDLDGAIEISVVVDATPEPLCYMDEADRIAVLVERKGSVEAAAESIQFSKSWVNQRYKLATGLCDRAKEAARSAGLKHGDAKRLATYVNPDGSPDIDAQHDLLDKLDDDGSIPAKKTKTRKIRNKSEHESLREDVKKLMEQRGGAIDAERLKAIDDLLSWYFLEKETEALFHQYDGDDEEETYEDDDADVVYKERT